MAKYKYNKLNANKGQGFGKVKNKKNMTNKELATKWTQGQPNTMEAKIEWLKNLIKSMATQMKSKCIWVKEDKGSRKQAIF